MNSVFFSPGSKSFYLQELFPEYEDAERFLMMLLKLPEKHMSNFLVCIQKGKKLALTVQDGQYGLIPTPFKRG